MPRVAIPRMTAKRVTKIVLTVVVIFCALFFGYQYFFRHTFNPWSTSDQIYFHGRSYRGGMEVSAAHIAGYMRVGRAPWPDLDVYTVSNEISRERPYGADYTGIVVYTWDHKYRTYGLVGGP